MHENKFEKQVREKMDQLGFDPSDGVWAAVDREINRENKRSRPLFWIILLSGLVLTGGGMFIAKHTNSKGNIAVTKMPEFSASKYPDTRQESKPAVGKTSAQDVIQLDVRSKTDQSNAGKKSGTVLSGNHPIFPFHPMSSNAASGRVSQQQIQAANPREPVKEQNAESAGQRKDDNNELTGIDSAVLAKKKADVVNPILPGDSVSILKRVKNNNFQTKTSPWSIGITGSVGISNIDQEFLQPVTATNFPYSSNYSTAAANPGARTLATPAEIHAGISFGLGVMVNRKLSKRLSLTAGLGYRYFSTTIHTGNAIDSPLNVYTANNQTSSVSSFYRNGYGREYINQYQFIELPVNFNLQVNKSSRTPVSWEAGFSLAWMIGNNALIFDPYTNVYYENMQSYHTTQWNVTTAVLVGFPVHDHSLQLGPQLQYGLTGLLKTGADHPGHLFFFGLKLSFIP